mmetsp:Transcript_69512/g.220047  ORF Transcript_69512/g.220047 Transcript_69512/m.220047 type:complete len:365 (+) Transcript_69512:2263-3357(+)
MMRSTARRIVECWCVTTTYDAMPFSASAPPLCCSCPLPSTLMDRIRSSTTVEAMGSSPAVGSSYMTISSMSLSTVSSWMMARASATRFFMPPDSSLGNLLSTSAASPTRSRLFRTSSRMCSSGSLASSISMNPTFSPTLSESKSAALWNTIPTLRSMEFWSEMSPTRFFPITRTSPLSGSISPAMILRIVDLPVPEGPMMPTASPLRILNEAPCRIFFLPKALCTLTHSRSTSESPPADSRPCDAAPPSTAPTAAMLLSSPPPSRTPSVAFIRQTFRPDCHPVRASAPDERGLYASRRAACAASLVPPYLAPRARPNRLACPKGDVEAPWDAPTHVVIYPPLKRRDSARTSGGACCLGVPDRCE